MQRPVDRAAASRVGQRTRLPPAMRAAGGRSRRYDFSSSGRPRRDTVADALSRTKRDADVRRGRAAGVGGRRAQESHGARTAAACAQGECSSDLVSCRISSRTRTPTCSAQRRAWCPRRRHSRVRVYALTPRLLHTQKRPSRDKAQRSPVYVLLGPALSAVSVLQPLLFGRMRGSDPALLGPAPFQPSSSSGCQLGRRRPRRLAGARRRRRVPALVDLAHLLDLRCRADVGLEDLRALRRRERRRGVRADTTSRQRPHRHRSVEQSGPCRLSTASRYPRSASAAAACRPASTPPSPAAGKRRGAARLSQPPTGRRRPRSSARASWPSSSSEESILYLLRERHGRRARRSAASRRAAGRRRERGPPRPGAGA